MRDRFGITLALKFEILPLKKALCEWGQPGLQKYVSSVSGVDSHILAATLGWLARPKSQAAKSGWVSQ